jgi:predicted nuclease of predicted toxin-antitoxin system
MRVKLDENLVLAHVRFLTQLGHEADRVHDQGLSGAPDDEVWHHVCQEGRFFITLDLDFSDVRSFPPGSHAGILLLRPQSRGKGAVLGVLLRVLEERPLSDLTGCLAVADEIQTRVRRP